MHVYIIPSHTSHWLQPADKTLFASLKEASNSVGYQKTSGDSGGSLQKSEFSEIFNIAMQRATCAIAISRFVNTGLYPVNRQAITECAFGPSLTTDDPQFPVQPAEPNSTATQAEGPDSTAAEPEGPGSSASQPERPDFVAACPTDPQEGPDHTAEQATQPSTSTAETEVQPGTSAVNASHIVSMILFQCLSKCKRSQSPSFRLTSKEHFNYIENQQATLARE